MKRLNGKSHCAVNFALEAVGDQWTLLVVRDIAFDGKHTFKEFLASDERIASNILSNRLTQLEDGGIIAKQPNKNDRRAPLYTLTNKGIDLIPVLLELSSWSFKYDPETDADKDFAAVYYADPTMVTKRIQAGVREGRAAFAGDDSIAKELFDELKEQ